MQGRIKITLGIKFSSSMSTIKRNVTIRWKVISNVRIYKNGYKQPYNNPMKHVDWQ